jgi:hypothetical protein
VFAPKIIVARRASLFAVHLPVLSLLGSPDFAEETGLILDVSMIKCMRRYLPWLDAL